MKLVPQYRIRTLFAITLVVSLSLAAAFSSPALTVADSECHHMKFGPSVYLVIKNTSFMPIWYPDLNSDNAQIGIGVIRWQSGLVNRATYPNECLKPLWPRQQANIHFGVFGRGDELGVEITDWLGRTHTLYFDELDIDAACDEGYQSPLGHKYKMPFKSDRPAG